MAPRNLSEESAPKVGNEATRKFNFPPGLSIRPSTLRVNGNSKSWPDYNEAEWIKDYGIAGRIWEAGYALSFYLNPPEDFPYTFEPTCPLRAAAESQQATVVEIGSGTGFIGLQIARLLPSNAMVVLTDLEEVLPLLEQNTRRERTSTYADIRVQALRWGSTVDAERLEETIRASRVELSPPGATPVRRLTHIVCSDLVFFVELHAPLLVTLLQLTSPDYLQNGTDTPQVIIAYQMRDLTKETPFWQAFGYWFHFTPVILQSKSAVPRFPDTAPTLPDQFSCLPWVGGRGYDLYIFVAKRRPERLSVPVPAEQDILAYGTDSYFETMMLMNLPSSY